MDFLKENLNTIIEGDCLEKLKDFPDRSVDFIFADPPYFMQTEGELKRFEGTKFQGVEDHWDKFGSFKEYDTFCLGWLKECQRILKDNGSICVIGSFQNIFRIGFHLQNLGLSNTTLSSAEENALKLFNNSIGGNTPCGLTWQSFKLGDLFEVLPYKKRFDANKVNIYASKTKDTYPYVVRTSLNNGIRGYLKENTNFLNAGNTISFGQDTATMFYQEKPYFTGDKIKILRCKNPNFNKINALFFITSLTKAFRNFSWGSASFSVSIIENQNISLPTNQHGEIDFNFMHTFINALMKQTIQGVAEYCDAKIQATKEAISQEMPTQKDSLF